MDYLVMQKQQFVMIATRADNILKRQMEKRKFNISYELYRNGTVFFFLPNIFY